VYTWYIASRDVPPPERPARAAKTRPRRDDSHANCLRIGRHVKRARIAAGMTQQELGTLSNVGVVALRRIELGRGGVPAPHSLLRMERVLGASLHIAQ